MGESFKSRLEKMQRNLYRKELDEDSQKPEKTLLPKKKFNEKTTWDINGEPIQIEKKSLATSFLFKILIFSVIFFLLAVGASFYLFFYGFNIISGRNIDIEIQGPQIIKAGDEINLQTTITNNNKAPLTSVSVTFSYPSGTLSALDRASSFPIDEQKIGTINQKQIANVSSRAIIFGESNVEQEIRVTMEYRFPDSNAIYLKEKSYKVLIGASPLDLSIDLPSEVNSGQEFSAIIKLVSNSETVLKNVSLTLDYPATGFMLKSAEPQPLTGGKIWQLGDIPAGSEKVIKLMCVIEGQNEDIKSFRAKVTSSPLGSSDQEVFEYGEVFNTATIKRSFVNANFTINGSNRSEVVIKPGSQIEVFVKWENNLTDRILDGKVVARLEGSLIDKYSISSTEGFYNSSEDNIIWDKSNTIGLADLEPGEAGESSFHFRLLNFDDKVILENPSLKISLSFEGRRVDSNQLSEFVSTNSNKIVKVETLPSFEAYSSYGLGPLKNSGPLPPRVGVETTFSIVWSVSNTINSLENGKIKTTLPAYVGWIGSFSPPDEKVIYDPSTREVSWEVGEVETGVGYESSARQVYFQVSVTPSLSQLGQFVRLTNKAVFQSVDSFTDTVIVKEQDAVTTELPKDSNLKGKNQVIE